MPQIKCPNCLQEIETVPNSNVLQCQCGMTLDLNEQAQVCPSCQSPSTADAVICTECGHNFKTGKAAEAGPSFDEEEEDEFSIFQQYKALIKLAVAIVLLAIAGIVVISSMGKKLGITSKDPLGTRAELETYFQQIGLTKTKGDTLLQLHNIEGSTLHYTDESMKKFAESLLVVLDKDGKVCGVSGSFMTHDLGPGGSRIGGFMRFYWEEIGGKTGDESFDTGAVRAKWHRSAETLISMAPVKQESVTIVLKESAYDEALKRFED